MLDFLKEAMIRFPYHKKKELMKKHQASVMNIIWQLLECEDYRRYTEAFIVIMLVLELEEDNSPVIMQFVREHQLVEKI